MTVLSKIRVAAALLDLDVKKALLQLVGNTTITALGTDNTNAVPIVAGHTLVLAADGTVGVILPKSEKDAVCTVVNTVSNQTLKVYPDAGAKINALTATTGAFSQVGGATCIYICDADLHWYVAAANLTGTSTSSSTAELDTLHSVTAGTVAASKALVVDANKAVDISRATTERDLGGTGVPGGALVQTEINKEVTAIADATATSVLTVTVPNAAHAAMVEVAIVSRLGAGGAIGADECVSVSKYNFGIGRTAGVASVCTASSQLGVVNVAVAGATTVTATMSVTNNSEGVTSTNTHTLKITITKGGGSSANHKCDVFATVRNANASGVTIA